MKSDRSTLPEPTFNLGVKEVQLQTGGTSVDALVKTGELLAAIGDRIP